MQTCFFALTVLIHYHTLNRRNSFGKQPRHELVWSESPQYLIQTMSSSDINTPVQNHIVPVSQRMSRCIDNRSHTTPANFKLKI